MKKAKSAGQKKIYNRKQLVLGEEDLPLTISKISIRCTTRLSFVRICVMHACGVRVLSQSMELLALASRPFAPNYGSLPASCMFCSIT